ncbi:MAG: carbohydrate ABC transporter permease [Chloroflexi bacterium]|nr:carbohydrate ABC transporter permease [Chloroflexota bacterium]
MLETDRKALAETDEPKNFPIGSEGWRRQWTLDNYEKVVNADRMGDAFLNSLLITIPSVVIPITIAAFAAYAFAWLSFPAKDLLFALVIVAMGVPGHLALVPILRLYLRVDLGGTYMGVWLAHTGFGLPLAIYLIYGYMITIPREIMESAHIDGASAMTAFTRLILPLSIPVIAAFAIFQFLWVWNDLLIALVFLGTEAENAVLTARLSELIGSKGQDWEVLTAGAFITMLVPLIIFFALQRFFVRGLTAGSVKG